MNSIGKSHTLILNDRKVLLITGVSELVSFDEETVSVITSGTELTVSGTSLSLTRLSLETGEVDVSGHIDSLCYADEAPKGKSFVSRLLGRE